MEKDYRYNLTRYFGHGKHVVFIGLNPSTATESDDDPTVRRMIGFAKAWGFGSMTVVNLFAIRATKPNEMLKHSDPIGQHNDEAIRTALYRSDLNIACWGNHGSHLNRDNVIKSMGYDLHCIWLNKNGTPAHPLYLKSEIKPKLFHIVK